jgi:hypothetical protein
MIYSILLTYKTFKAEKNFIVDKHNELRRKVAKGLELRGASGSGPQPAASEMYQLVWDQDLARMSQRFAIFRR